MILIAHLVWIIEVFTGVIMGLLKKNMLHWNTKGILPQYQQYLYGHLQLIVCFVPVHA